MTKGGGVKSPPFRKEFMELLEVTEQDGKFHSAPDLKGSPVPNEQVIENIRASARFDLPILEKQKKKEGSFIFIGGGPTLTKFIDEIKERSKNGEYICTSNQTYDFLVEKGIIPTACVIVDPKECVQEYIKNPQIESVFYIGTVCNPNVAKNLIKSNMNVVKLLVAYGIEDESDITVQKELYNKSGYNYLVGGTMMGLRALNFAVLLGFSKIEYYGFDSCYDSDPELITDDDPRYEEIKEKFFGLSYTDADTGKQYTINPNGNWFFYAYKKPRREHIQIAKTPDGKKFLTSPCFAHQANQFIKWVDRMEGKVEVEVHGYNLSSHLLKCHRKHIKKLKENIGIRKWSDKYYELQKELHSRENTYYGIQGDVDVEFIGRAVLALYAGLKRPITVLDYGCGKGKLGNELKKVFNIVEVTNYDPFVSEYSKEPDGMFDIVACMDVMEHVEIQCVKNTLEYITSKVKYAVQFSIHLNDAAKVLADGRNAHITQKSANWWISNISEHLGVVEAIQNLDRAYLICQTFNAKESLDKELYENNSR